MRSAILPEVAGSTRLALSSLSMATGVPVLFALAACAAPDQADEGGGSRPLHFQFVEVARFGIEGTMDSDLEDPRILKSVMDFVESEDATLYVVDQGAKAIVHFAQDGSLIKSFGRGGSGPGEFEFPFRIAQDSRGRVYVLDPERVMVSRFSGDGRHQTSFRVPVGFGNGGDIAIWRDTLFLTGRFLQERGVVHIHDLDGRPIGRSVDVSERELDYGTKGISGSLAAVPSVGVVYADPAPSTWRLVGPGAGRRGRDALNGRRIEAVEFQPGHRQIRAPGQTAGIASFGRGRVAVSYVLFDFDGVGAVAKPATSWAIDIYDLAGGLLGSCELEDFPASSLAGGKDPEGIVYMSSYEPYPHVGKYRVVESSGPAPGGKGICKPVEG